MLFFYSLTQVVADIHNCKPDRNNTKPGVPSDKRVHHQLMSENAYRQRQMQSNLAGMGALSHASQHDICVIQQETAASQLTADYRYNKVCITHSINPMHCL